MDISSLVKISSRSWSLEILAHLHRGTPGRQAALLSAVGAGRTAFGYSLNHLIELDLLERSPGHGHPLRPEFRLTAQGEQMAAIADQILPRLLSPEQSKLLRRSWTVPLLAVSTEPQPFSALKQRLPITDRALSQSLKSLVGRRWMSRQIDTDQYPPRPYYQAANLGARISRALNVDLS